jgi:hypothetical protein
VKEFQKVIVTGAAPLLAGAAVGAAGGWVGAAAGWVGAAAGGFVAAGAAGAVGVAVAQALNSSAATIIRLNTEDNFFMGLLLLL